MNPSPSSAHAPLKPFALAFFKLPDGNSIEEFIGHQEHGAIGDPEKKVMPCRFGPEFCLSGAFVRPGSSPPDECARLRGTRHDLSGPQNICHQRAASWPQLHEIEVSGLAHGIPCGGTPHTNRLTKDLRNLRGR